MVGHPNINTRKNYIYIYTNQVYINISKVSIESDHCALLLGQLGALGSGLAGIVSATRRRLFERCENDIAEVH